MTHEEIKQELAIIKKMLEKARRETAESGQFFIWIGVFSIVAVFMINRFETWRLNHLVLPALLITLIVCVLIGYFTVARKETTRKAQSYPKTICYSVWFACAVPVVLITFVFPLLDVYSWSLTPVLSSLILGIAVFSSGVIFESKPIIWCGPVWWAGAVAMVFVHDTPRMLIMMAVILLGWVLPGFILHRRYKHRSGDDEL